VRDFSLKLSGKQVEPLWRIPQIALAEIDQSPLIFSEKYTFIDETGKELFPELMPELDAIKERTVSGLVFRRDHDHRRRRVPLPWITPRGGLDYLRATVKRIVRALGSATSLTSRHFATADLLKEQTPIFPMPNFAQRDATERFAD
jgi:hypothetical protein